MIYFGFSAVAIFLSFWFVSDFSDSSLYPKTLFAALVTLVIYICLKAFEARIYNISDHLQVKFFSVLVVPLYSVSILLNSKHTAHIEFLEQPLATFLLLFVLADIRGENLRFVEASGITPRQKDSFFMPPKQYSGKVYPYILKLTLFYLFVFIYGDRLSFL